MEKIRWLIIANEFASAQIKDINLMDGCMKYNVLKTIIHCFKILLNVLW